MMSRDETKTKIISGTSTLPKPTTNKMSVATNSLVSILQQFNCVIHGLQQFLVDGNYDFQISYKISEESHLAPMGSVQLIFEFDLFFHMTHAYIRIFLENNKFSSLETCFYTFCDIQKFKDRQVPRSGQLANSMFFFYRPNFNSFNGV